MHILGLNLYLQEMKGKYQRTKWNKKMASVRRAAEKLASGKLFSKLPGRRILRT